MIFYGLQNRSFDRFDRKVNKMFETFIRQTYGKRMKMYVPDDVFIVLRIRHAYFIICRIWRKNC